MAFEGPAGLDPGDARQAGLEPGGGSSFEDCDLALAGLEEIGGHASTFARLTDEDDWDVALRSARRDSIWSMGMLTAPGMCPEANSEGERTSTRAATVDAAGQLDGSAIRRAVMG